MHLYDLRRVLCQDNSLAERFEITNHLLRFDFPRYLAGIAGIVTRYAVTCVHIHCILYKQTRSRAHAKPTARECVRLNGDRLVALVEIYFAPVSVLLDFLCFSYSSARVTEDSSCNTCRENDAASVHGSPGISLLQRKRDLQGPTDCQLQSVRLCYERSGFC